MSGVVYAQGHPDKPLAAMLPLEGCSGGMPVNVLKSCFTTYQIAQRIPSTGAGKPWSDAGPRKGRCPRAFRWSSAQPSHLRTVTSCFGAQFLPRDCVVRSVLGHWKQLAPRRVVLPDPEGPICTHAHPSVPKEYYKVICHCVEAHQGGQLAGLHERRHTLEQVECSPSLAGAPHGVRDILRRKKMYFGATGSSMRNNADLERT